MAQKSQKALLQTFYPFNGGLLPRRLKQRSVESQGVPDPE
jgi:hypothetical protein